MSRKNKRKKKTNPSSPHQMPKWPVEQVRQQRSFEHVRSVFSDWRPVPLQETDIALDLRFEIIEPNGDTTGAEFCVQVKAKKELKPSDGSVSYPCEVSTLNYFLERPELILFVVYDAKEKKAYWIWVQDYIHQNWRPEWEQQDTVTLKIPIANVLNQAAVTTIEQRVRWHHEQQRWVTAAQTVSDPHYKFSVTTEENQVTVGISPRYPGAENDNPVILSGRLKFDRGTPEGAEAFARYERHIKLGDDLELDDRFLDGFDLPSPFTKLLAPSHGLKIKSITLQARESNEIIPVKYVFTSADRLMQCEIPFVELRLRRAGTEQWLLSNEGQQIPFRVTAIVHKDNEADLQFQTDATTTDVKDVLNILRLLSVVARGGKIQTVFLKTTFITESDIPPTDVIPPPPWMLELAENLAYIERMARVRFRWPDEFSVQDAMVAKELREALKTGTMTIGASRATLSVDGNVLRRFQQVYQKGKFAMLGLDMPSYRTNLFGTEVDLGHGRLIAPQAKLTDESEKLMDNLDKTTINNVVDLEFEFGPTPLILQFPQWAPQAQNTQQSSSGRETQ